MGSLRTSEQVIPSARRLIKSLRDIGYNFSEAIADVIDNSITAEGNNIAIDIEFDGDHSKIRITDNGIGMTRDQLLEAMRFGSERDYLDEELGKFGLGLKTASLSQCRRLTVASRVKNGEINAYCWDLDHVEKTNRWELIIPSSKELEKILGGNLTNKSGTVVFWQYLDRMLGQKLPYGEQSKNRLRRMSRELEEHITMVFHRFLNGEVPQRKLKISLNGNELAPWDPFSRDQEYTKSLDPIFIHLAHEDLIGRVVMRPYILPPQDKFEPLSAFDRASGPNKWNQQQGFYIFRADRLIQSGGWCRLRATDEHTKLARIALEFSPYLDDAFKINVQKARREIMLPEEIREEIEKATGKIVAKAREIYDKKDRPKPPAIINPIQPPITVPPAETPDPSVLLTNQDVIKPVAGDKNLYAQNMWTLDDFQIMLEVNAKRNELPIITSIIKRLKRKLNDHKGGV
jgi:hypothetical protein